MLANTINNVNTITVKTDSLTKVLKEQNQAIETIAKSINSASKPEKLFDLFSYDTVFTVVITLAIFLLGIVIDRLIKIYDAYKSKKELRLYFKTYLDRITNSTCVKLSESYKYFYQDVDIDSGIPPTSPKVLTGDFERLKSIDGNLFFHAIREKEPLSKILSNLDFVEKLIPEVERYHTHCRVESDKLLSPFQEMINSYFDLLAEYIEHVRVNQPNFEHQTEFTALVNSSILAYHQEYTRTRKLRKLYKEIIRPIQEVAIRTNIFRQDQLCFNIVVLGKRISHQYNYLKRLTIDFKLGYRKFHRDVQESKVKLEAVSKKINWC